MIALFKRDIMLAFRAGGGFGLALAFFLILTVLVPFGVGPETDRLALIAPGILWVGALLASLLSLDRLFQLDFEDGSLELLATSPLPLEAAILIKSLSHWLTTGLPLAVMAPLLGLILALPESSMPALVTSLFVGTPALSLLGAFGAAITVGLKRGGLLISLLVLPLYVPTLIFGALAVADASESWIATTPLLLTLGITLLSVAIVPFAAAFALRMNLR